MGWVGGKGGPRDPGRTPDAGTHPQAGPNPHTGGTHTVASISSGCSLATRSIRSNRLVIAASRTLQGQRCGEEPRRHVTCRPHTLNQSEFQRLTVASVRNIHQTQYRQPTTELSPRSTSKDARLMPEGRCHVPSVRTNTMTLPQNRHRNVGTDVCSACHLTMRPRPHGCRWCSRADSPAACGKSERRSLRIQLRLGPLLLSRQPSGKP